VDVGKWLGTAVTAATAGIPDTNVKNMNNVSASAITTIKAVQGLAVDGVITTLTNLPAITANWLTAAGINAAALNGKGDWNLGKNGYSLTQTFPINFSAMSLTAGGLVTLAGVTHTGAVIPTVSAVTGLTASNLDATVSSRSTYAGGAVASVTADVGITQAGADKAWGSAVRTLTAGTNIVLAKGVGVTGFNDIAAGDAMTLTAAYDAAKTAATQASVNAIPITAPDNAGIATAVAQTAGLTFTKAGEVNVNLQSVNDVTIVGTGAPGDLFRV